MKLATISDNGKIKAGMIVGEEFICCDEGKNANTAVLAMISSGNISEWQAMLDKAPRKKLSEIKNIVANTLLVARYYLRG